MSRSCPHRTQVILKPLHIPHSGHPRVKVAKSTEVEVNPTMLSEWGVLWLANARLNLAWRLDPGDR